jgi:hypothetical protein
LTRQQWDHLKPGDVVEFFLSKRRVTIAGPKHSKYGYPIDDGSGKGSIYVGDPRQVDLVEEEGRAA